MQRRLRDRKKKKITYKMQANFLLVFCLVVVLLVALIAVMVKINVKDGEVYAKKVLSQQSYTSSEIPYRRGDIYDKNEVLLATSVKVYNLALDPSFILTKSNGKYLYRDSVVDILTKYFKIDKDKVEKVLKEKATSKYYVLKKGLSTKEVDDCNDYIKKTKKDKNAMLKGMWFEEEYIRKYPLNSLASSVIGFVYDKNEGSWGIEERYNYELNGSTGRTYGYYDSELNLERVVKESVNGNSIVSTIDSNIQKIVEKNIKDFNNKTSSDNVAVIISDPNTGNITAMSSLNGMYDLNKPRDLSNYYSKDEQKNMSEKEKSEALNKMWRNYCISDTYEPGSTFKPFVVASGLEENVITKDSYFVCDGGEVVAKGTNPIHCAKRQGHGTISLSQSLMFSCNDALMNIAKKLGRDKFADCEENFYFGNTTGIDLSGESSGIVYKSDGLNPLELATSSFGQGMNVTMIQMVAGFSSLINGGSYYEPRVAEKIVNDNGITVDSLEPVLVKKTVSEDTSKFIKDALKKTVEKGTAKDARVEGYSIGGKTGTAQKLPRSSGDYLVSFIGCAPAEEPTMMIYVIVDKPHVSDQSNCKYAQKLAANIMKEVFPFLEINPNESYAKKLEEKEKEKKEKQEEENNKKQEKQESSYQYTDGEDYNYQSIDTDNIATDESNDKKSED